MTDKIIALRPEFNPAPVSGANGASAPIGKAKITAAQVRKDCPAELEDWCKRVGAHLDLAQKFEKKRENNETSAGQLLVLIAEACDEEAFEVCREKFYPALGLSRAKELKAVAAGKKTVEEIRAATRARVARHRARQAAVTSDVTAANGAGVASETASVAGDGADHSDNHHSADHDDAHGEHHLGDGRARGGERHNDAIARKPERAAARAPTGGNQQHDDERRGGEQHDDPVDRIALFVDLWCEATSDERGFICDLVLEQYLTPASGAEICARIPAGKRAEVLAALLESTEVDDFLQIVPPHLRRGLEKRVLNQRGLKRSDQITKILVQVLSSRSPAEQITALAKVNELLAADGFKATDMHVRIPKARK